MCMACEEMQLYCAYLDAVEEAKRKSQPWQCEVTLIPEAGGSESKAAAVNTRSKGAKPASGSRPGFVCDDPE